MLKLVNQRGRRQVLYIGLLPRIAELGVGIGHHRVIHLRDVASRAALQVEAVFLWEEIALEKEATDHAVGAARRQLIHFLREENQNLAVLIDIRRLAEILDVEWRDERVEQRREARVLRICEATRR